MTSKKIIDITEDTTPSMADVLYGTDSAGSTDKRFSASTLAKLGGDTYGEADNRKLWNHRQTLAAVVAGTAREVIGYLGDSTTEGANISTVQARAQGVCQRLLRERFSTADIGRGYIPVTNGVSVTPASAPTLAGAYSVRNTEGLGFRSVALTASGAMATWTLFGTDMVLCYASYSGSPKSEYRITPASTGTPGSWVEVDHNGGSGFNFREEQTAVHLGAVDTYTVEWRWKADGAGAAPDPVIEGIIEINGDPTRGISVLDMGHSGFTAADFLSGDDALVTSWISDHDITAVVLGLGFNEWQTAVAPATYKANLVTLIALLRAGNANLEVILHGGYTPLAAGDPDDWHLYVDAMYEVAAADELTSVYDLRRFMPDPGVVTTADHYDVYGLHPNATGGAAIGAADADHLSLRSGGGYAFDRLSRYSPVGGGYVSGDRIWVPWVTSTTRTVAQGNLFLIPWLARSGVTLDRLYAEVSTAGTGSTVLRFGIWNHDHSTGKPGTLILDAGTASGLSTAEVSVTISQVLPAGWVWLGVVGQTVTGSPAVRGFNNGLSGPGATMIPPVGAISSSLVPANCLLVTGVTGALSTLVGASFSSASASGPQIQGRVA